MQIIHVKEPFKRNLLFNSDNVALYNNLFNVTRHAKSYKFITFCAQLDLVFYTLMLNIHSTIVSIESLIRCSRKLVATRCDTCHRPY